MQGFPSFITDVSCRAQDTYINDYCSPRNYSYKGVRECILEINGYFHCQHMYNMLMLTNERTNESAFLLTCSQDEMQMVINFLETVRGE